VDSALDSDIGRRKRVFGARFRCRPVLKEADLCSGSTVFRSVLARIMETTIYSRPYRRLRPHEGIILLCECGNSAVRPQVGGKGVFRLLGDMR